MLRQGGFLVGPQLKGAEDVLAAAALNYVAALAQSISHFLYFALHLVFASQRDER